MSHRDAHRTISLKQVRIVGTPGTGKRSLAYALLRDMGEGGPIVEEEGASLSPSPKQAAIINNQKCLIECDDVYPEDDEDVETEVNASSKLLPKGGAVKGGSSKLRHFVFTHMIDPRNRYPSLTLFVIPLQQ